LIGKDQVFTGHVRGVSLSVRSMNVAPVGMSAVPVGAELGPATGWVTALVALATVV